MADTPIKQQIDRLLSVRDDIGDALEDMGVTVPSGMKLNNVPNLVRSIQRGASETTIAPVEASTTASEAHALGSIFYLNGILYRALSNIDVGGTINTADGGNAVQTSVAQNFKRIVTLTSAQYESLSSAEKTADIVYVITDDNTVPAGNVSYDGTQSHLAAGNIQQAVDVLADAVGNKQAKILVSGLLKGDGHGGVAAAVEGTDYGTYSKPSGGIPKTDLASGVQTSLGLADTAYQKPSGGIPKTDLASGVIPSNPATEQQIAPIETGTTASQAYAIGDFFCWNGLLYKAIADIAAGQTFTVDTNCEQTTVMTENQAKQDILTFDTAPTADSPNPVTSDGINSAIKARYSTNTIFDTITDVHTDVTITMDHSFTSFKFLMIIFNTSSAGSASKRMPLVLATNALPQGGFYPLINSDGSGYIRINYISGQAKQVRFQATSFASLYVTSIIGLN